METGSQSRIPPRASGLVSSLGSALKRVEQGGLVWALAAGLIARLLMITVEFHWTAVPNTSDDATYVRFAHTLLETGGLPTHHFPVGYPLFVAPFLLLGDAAFPAIRVVHVLFGLLTVVTVSRITGLLYGARAALFAAWFTALYPPLVFMTGRIMSETLFSALLTLSLWHFLLSDRDESTPHAIWAGVLLAVASLVRSNLVPMLPLIPIWYLAKRGASLRQRLLRVVACLGVAVSILMLPGFYFLATTGQFIPFATNAGQTFYGANNPLADGGWVEVQDHPELLSSIPPEVRASPVAFSKAQQQLGVTWIRENPGAFLALLPKKFGNAWVPGFQSSETTSRSKAAAIVLPVCLGLLLLAAIAGRVLLKPAARDGILLAVLATYTVMSLAFYGNPRIGLFCAPVLIVYAAACAAALSARLEARAA